MPFDSRTKLRRATESPYLSPGGPSQGGRRRLCAICLRPTLLRRSGLESMSSLNRSANSFCTITSSQKETTASHDLSLPTMALTTARSYECLA
ncbi:jg2482 [Pararge aegeria aegeria]|uniref:Jg2482 protein n=1 Tax=Pararge aegeria aegeria TaxID=348720 RepID=A0A8S4RSJ6_9NEOP|nr:jg2482 [Pararge aegeria aegeria]